MRKRCCTVSLLLMMYCAGFGQLPTSVSFDGRVQDAAGRSIPGATLRLQNTGYVAVADSGGHFRFSESPHGRFTLEGSAVGYATTTRSVDLGGVVRVTIVLPVQGTTLESVTVTAEKKEEGLDQVPGSVAVLTESDITAYRLWQSRDLTGIVSNLSAANPGDGRNVVSVRGITSTSYDPAVVTYIDGVSQFSLDTYIPQLFDVEKIEVLKGPQGTLYGRNAMGGVISITTRQPDEREHLDVSLSAGTQGLQRYTAGYRAPLVKNKLYFGIAGIYEGSNGFYTNDFYGNHFDKQHRAGGNAFLQYRFNPRWQVTANVKQLSNRDNGAFPLASDPATAVNDPFHLSQDAVGKMIDNTLNASLVVKHSGHGVGFSSQTAYQSNYRYYAQPVDGDFSPADAVTVVNNYGRPWNKVKVWTQEFRLASPAGGTGPFSWAAGSLLFHQDVPTKQGTHFGKDAALVGSPDINYSVVNSTRGKTDGYAFYGQAEYRLASSLAVAAGVRYDGQRSRAGVSGLYLPDGSTEGFPTRTDTAATANFHSLSPMLSFTWRPSAEHSVYLSYRRGYRTGGLTALSSDPSQPPLYPYKAEYSSNYEAGSRNFFFHERLSLDVAIFYTRVSDAQVPTLILPDAVTVTRNAGSLDSRGVEFGMKALPATGLSVDYQFGYTHARYTNLKLAANGNTADLDGHTQVFTPETTSMLAVQYSRPVNHPGSFSWFLRGEWVALGKTYFDLANQYTQGAYQLLNFSAGISVGQIALSAWIRNATDNHYLAYVYDFGAARLGDARSVGVTLRYRMN